MGQKVALTLVLRPQQQQHEVFSGCADIGSAQARSKLSSMTSSWVPSSWTLASSQLASLLALVHRQEEVAPVLQLAPVLPLDRQAWKPLLASSRTALVRSHSKLAERKS